MGPDVYGPTPAVVAPSLVDVLLIRLVEEGKQFFLGVAQVNLVPLRAHELIPLTQASQEGPVRLRLGHPQGQHLSLLPELSQSGPHQSAQGRSQPVAQVPPPTWRRPVPSPSPATARNGHRNKRWRPRAPFVPLPET